MCISDRCRNTLPPISSKASVIKSVTASSAGIGGVFAGIKVTVNSRTGKTSGSGSMENGLEAGEDPAVDAVSYTHLDVYKRQTEDNCQISGKRYR